MKLSQNPVWLALLDVPAVLYGAAVALRNRRYDRGGAAAQAPLPVISVGNLTVGGTGKTPMVQWVARRLLDRGLRPGVVIRGYRGRAGRGPLVVSAGDGPRVGFESAGDEPLLHAAALPGVPVVAGSDRLAGCREVQALGADVALLDDGFQHRKLHRDLDIVLLDAHAPFGNYRLLPAGSLREPADSLRRADVIVITRAREGERFIVLEQVIRQHNPAAPLLRAGHRRTGYVDADGRVVERPARVVAFCGIGNPDSFAADLDAEKLELVAFHRFRDHHRFTADDWRRLEGEATAADAMLLTTEKDLVRLPDAFRSAPSPPVALRIETVVHEPAPLLSRLAESGRR